MYRTGPFILSEKLGLTPDLLTIGKGTSDMMFPFALTLYSDVLARRLYAVQPRLSAAIRRAYDYEAGYRTVLNVLRQAEELDLPGRVARAGDLVTEQLGAAPGVQQARPRHSGAWPAHRHRAEHRPLAPEAAPEPGGLAAPVCHAAA